MSLRRVALCSDEEGGEHNLLVILEDRVPELRALDFRMVYGKDHYEDGIETWQGPRDNFDQALVLDYYNGSNLT